MAISFRQPPAPDRRDCHPRIKCGAAITVARDFWIPAFAGMTTKSKEFARYDAFNMGTGDDQE